MLEGRLVWADECGLLLGLAAVNVSTEPGRPRFSPDAPPPSSPVPPAAVGDLRQGLIVQLGRSVARQLDALMMVTTEIPPWWAPHSQLPPHTLLQETRSDEPRAGRNPVPSSCYNDT